MRPVVLLVHGTFARNAPWTRPNSLLCRALRASLNNPDLRSVEWSGRNTFRARTEAAESIASCIQAVDSDTPIAIICHSHGGSAVAYGIRQCPNAFRNVRTVVCLATPFFGFSVRPGYQALLLATLVSVFFLMFQLLFLVLTALITEHFSPFVDQPYGMITIGFILLATAAAIAGALWRRRTRLFQPFEGVVRLAAAWDTTQVTLPHPLFVRSMGDEVGLALGTLQFTAMVLNRTLNLLSSVLSHVLVRIRRAAARPHGALIVISLAALLIAASGVLAAMAATFGYHPRYWIDILYPWSRGFHIVDPEFGVADHAARLVYALALFMVALAYAFMLSTALITLAAVFLSWITTAVFGCFSLRLAIAVESAVEPTPEGLHRFLNAGWSRNVFDLRNDRSTLQHSEPYSSDSVLESVVSHIAAHLVEQDRPRVGAGDA